MSFTFFENTAQFDDHVVSFDKVPTEADKENALRRIRKSWDGVMSDLNGLGGIKLVKPDFDNLFETLVKSGTHAVIYDLVLTKSEFRLDVIVGNTTVKAGSVRVPTELEDYRNFLSLLNGWSTTDHNIVPDSDFKKFNDANPKKPPKPPYKTYEDMAAKSKSDVQAFRAWAKTNSKAKAAFDAVDKTEKAKPNDAARVAALKAINVSLQDWYKTF